MKRVSGIFVVMISWAALVVSAQPAFATLPEGVPGVCETGMMPKELQVYDPQTQRLKFGPEQIAYLKLNRDNLRSIRARAYLASINQEHFIDRELLGMFSDKHVLVAGGPGAAKTAGSNLQQIPTLFGFDRVVAPSVFRIQMQPFLTELLIKGRFDEVAQILLNQGTLMQYERALVDELDKMPPQVVAAFNDLLNERIILYGSRQVRANTRHVLFTSNETAYGLLNIWRQMAPGGDQTARAFLARIPIRVLNDNYDRTPDGRARLIQLGVDREAGLARQLLMDPSSLYQRGPTVDVPPSDYGYPAVDFGWLRSLGRAGGLFLTDGGRTALNELTHRVRVEFNRMAMDSETEVEQQNGNGVIYMPPSGNNNRDMVQNIAPIAMDSLLMDLIDLTEEQLPTQDLARALERGLPVDAASAWRAQYHMLTGFAGDARLEVARVAGSNAPNYQVAFDNSRLLAVIESPSSIYERTAAERIIDERRVFLSAFEATMSNAQAVSQDSAQRLAPMQGVWKDSSEAAHSAEEVVYRLSRRR